VTEYVDLARDERFRAVADLEAVAGRPLPAHYRDFVVTGRPEVREGFRRRRILGAAALDMTMKTALAAGMFPVSRIVIEDLGHDTFALLDAASGSVERWSLRSHSDDGAQAHLGMTWHRDSVPLSGDFRSYQESAEHELALSQRLRAAVEEADATSGGYEHGQQRGKPLKARDWRPFRFMVQDVLVAATVVRLRRDLNAIEVDLFVTVDVPGYQSGESARALTLFLLAESVNCGATGEIRFTGDVESGSVPAALRQLAKRAGVELASGASRISAHEAGDLYLALTELGPEASRKLRVLAASGELPIEMAPFLVHSGVWRPTELGLLLGLAVAPGRVLTGGAVQEHRFDYVEDQSVARLAVLAGMLERHLVARPGRVLEDGSEADVEDDTRAVEAVVDPDSASLIVRCGDERVPVEWSLTGEPLELRAGQAVLVMPRPRDPRSGALLWREDLEALAARRSALGSFVTSAWLLLPSDADLLDPEVRDRLLSEASRLQLALLRAPDSLATIDAQVQSRFQRSRRVQR